RVGQKIPLSQLAAGGVNVDKAGVRCGCKGPLGLQPSGRDVRHRWYRSGALRVAPVGGLTDRRRQWPALTSTFHSSPKPVCFFRPSWRGDSLSFCDQVQTRRLNGSMTQVAVSPFGPGGGGGGFG